MSFKHLFFVYALLLSTALVYAEPPSEKDIYEEFALSEKREEVLKKLIPGTEIYFFLHTLYYQQNNNLKDADEMLAKWFKRFPYSAQLKTMKNRQTLLNFENNPGAAYQLVTENLGLQFNHGKPVSLAPQIYPDDLSPDVYNSEKTFANILSNYNNLSGVTTDGLFEISKRKLSSEQLQILLRTYPYPDLPNLVGLIIQDFQNFDKRLFGDLPIHQKLTLAQLNELKEIRPILLTHERFVNEYLSHITPASSQPLVNKPVEYKKYLQECWGFVKDLNPSFNSLKANILFAYLNVCLELNQPDFPLFKEYIKLPRQKFYANAEFYQKNSQGNEYIQYQKNYSNFILVPPIPTDEKLIETYLFKLIKSSGNLAEYQPYFEKQYFYRFEAETKIVTGLGKPEDFYNILSPTDLERIKNSLEISFTEQNKKTHLASDPVKLFIQLKNIPELEIQIYKLNMLDFYRSKNEEIKQEVSLEGYIPNITKKVNYQQASYIRHEEAIELTEIDTAGVYIVELFGNGIKTRTFIRKGNLYPAIYESNTGHEIQLFDDNQNKIIDYTVYFGKHQLNSDKSGIVMIPYATDKTIGTKNLIFAYKDISSIFPFNHRREQFNFSNLIINQPESLIAGQNCKIICKPVLQLNQKPIDTGAIKDLKAELRYFDNKGELLSSQTIKVEKIKDYNELASYIPESASRLNINLSGCIKRTADDEKEYLVCNNSLTLAGALTQSNILGLYLRKQNDLYQIECLNKAGVPQPNISIQVSLQHKYFSNPFNTTLQTNQKGYVTLGKINLINGINATLFNGPNSYWNLKSICTSRPYELTALENETLEIPMIAKNKSLSESFLFLKRNKASTIEDKTAALKIENDLLKIPTDSAGKYSLYIKEENRNIEVNILKGKKQGNYFVSEDTINDTPSYLAHQIILDPIDEKTDSIKGKVLNTNESMKVFLWAGRYYSNQPFFLDNQNDFFQWPCHQRFLEIKINQYFDSIQLSSEKKYIAGRKDIKKFPGNLLAMPSAILNPWDTAVANERAEANLQGGGEYLKKGGVGGGRQSEAKMYGGGKDKIANRMSSSLEFFTNAAILEVAVQKDGTFEINTKDLKDQSYLQIGVVSPYGFSIKEIAQVATKSVRLDIRQPKNNSALDDKLPAMTLAIVPAEKPMTFLQGDEKRVLKIDTLGKLHASLTEIIADGKINQFDFLGQWSSLKEEQKLDKYKEFACHELHFYLYQKDIKFFNAHIKPFLKNKQQKNFIDKWLLEEDLSSYLNLNQFNQLNIFEKILLVKRQPTLKEKVNSQIKEYLEVNKPNRQYETAIMEKLLNAVQSKKETKQMFEESISKSMDKQNSIKGELGAAPMEDLMEREESKKDGGSEKRKMAAAAPSKNAEAKLEKESDYLRRLEVSDKLSDSKPASIAFYRDVKDTKEYAEANYYHLERNGEYPELIQPNQFWLDYLNNTNSSFISENILAFTNLHEVLLAIAVTDIPEVSSDIPQENKDNQTTIKGKSPMIVLLKSFKTGAFKAGSLSLQQHYFIQNPDKKEILVAAEKPFLINKKYGCLTVVTNTTSEIKEFFLNYLIPEGSLPLDFSLRTKHQFVSIQPFTSFVIENQFFFPMAGTFSHLPGKAVDYENIFTNEKMYSISATADEEILDKNSWEYHVKEGNKEKILTYIKTHNLIKINLPDIYYLVKDKGFFDALTTELKSRFFFDYVVWSYSVFHKNKDKLSEFLPNTDFNNTCGTYFNSSLLTIDPIEKRMYEHKEYFPLVKGRTHPIENGNKFENVQFENHYRQFIDMLMYKPSLNNSDLFNLVIYTLNQQRVEEAIKYFSLIKENEIVEKLQYDYLKAYLAFYQEDLKSAEKILNKYKDLTILQWKEKFDELGIQLKEIKSGEIDSKSRGDKFSSTVLADKEAILKTKNNLGTIEIAYKNLKQCRVDYYETDLEILFSNAPFEVMNNQFQFLTTPNFSETITLKEGAEVHQLKLPENLKNKNLVIKVVGAGKESVVNYYPNQMDITISENYGELRVLSSDGKKPLSGVYVKVYGENGNGKDFVKDGYTDLRGIFNYTSVSGKPIKQYKNLAILTLSEKHGAAIQYTVPPAQ